MKIKVVFSICALLATLIIACRSGDTLEYDRYYSEGSVVYQNHCQNCHGAHGEGLNALIPPLTDSVFLKSNLHQLPCLLQNGLRGKLTINKTSFEGQMPAVTGLANIEVAQVLTYVTNSFGNKLGIFNVQSVNGDLGKCR